MVAYSLRFYSIIRVANEKKKLSDPLFWDVVRNLTTDDIEGQKEIYETFYWLNNGNNYSIVCKLYQFL